MSDQSIRPGDVTNLPPRLTITKWQLVYVGWTLTLLAYIVVLNLWVEFNDKVVIDSFVISIATSVVLLVLLVIILGLEHRVKRLPRRQKDALIAGSLTLAELDSGAC